MDRKKLGLARVRSHSVLPYNLVSFEYSHSDNYNFAVTVPSSFFQSSIAFSATRKPSIATKIISKAPNFNIRTYQRVIQHKHQPATTLRESPLHSTHSSVRREHAHPAPCSYSAHIACRDSADYAVYAPNLDESRSSPTPPLSQVLAAV
jgi:hypothetical protein